MEPLQAARQLLSNDQEMRLRALELQVDKLSRQIDELKLPPQPQPTKTPLVRDYLALEQDTSKARILNTLLAQTTNTWRNTATIASLGAWNRSSTHKCLNTLCGLGYLTRRVGRRKGSGTPPLEWKLSDQFLQDLAGVNK